MTRPKGFWRENLETILTTVVRYGCFSQAGRWHMLADCWWRDDGQPILRLYEWEPRPPVFPIAVVTTLPIR